jgi:hypothetical protein
MAIKFNPLTGNFDFTGSGGGGGDSYIDGEVQNFSALPTSTPPAVDSAYLVREAEGTWLLNRKPAGIYIRTDDSGVRADDWTHAGAFPDVFNDANFLLYDNADSSKNLAFQLSGITTGTTRTLTVPNASGRIQVEGQPIGNTTPAAGTFTTLTANTSLAVAGGIVTGASNVLEMVNGSNAQTLRIYSSFPLANIFSRLSIRGAIPFSGNHIIATERGTSGGTARGLDLQTDSVTRLTLGETGGVTVASGNLTLTDNTGSETATFDAQGKLTANRTYDLPDSSGTLALLETLPAGGTKTYAVFTATDNQPTATAFMTLDTRNSISVLDADDTSTESAVFVGILPEAASLGSGLIVSLRWMATTATSGDVRWSVAWEKSNTDLDSDSFDTATAATATTNGTSGIVTVTNITCTTIDSLAAGDLFRLRVQRIGGDAADTMTGDAELVAVEIRSAA